MINRSISRSLGLFTALCLVLFVFSCTKVSAATRVVDTINIRVIPDGAEIHINFNLLFQYVTHTPADTGDHLQILFRTVRTPPVDVDLSARETFSWKPSEAVPLLEVIYEEISPGKPSLVLRFTGDTQFRVRGGADFRSVVVTIPSISMEKPVKSPVPEKVEPPEEEPPVEKRREAELDDYLPDRYAINLLSSIRTIKEPVLPDFDGRENYLLYTTTFEKDGNLWHRLRLGFFPTEKAAREVLSNLIARFPQAWVTIVSLEERMRVTGEKITPAPLKKAKELKPPGPEKKGEEKVSPGISEERLTKFMDEAKKASTGGDYRRAIQIYTKVLQYPDHKYRPEAQELLGLARERNGQIAHARAEYEEYLRQYPKGDGAARVRQRLAGLLTARAKPRERLRKGKKREGEKVWTKETYGSFSQFYNRDVSTSDLAGETINQNSLSTNLDFNTRMKSARYDVGTFFIGEYLKDFEDSAQDEFSVSQLYLYGRHLRRHHSLRLGRQSESRSGILGRYDGGLLRIQISSALRLNGVVGFPVEFDTGKGLETDKRFYGASLDLGTFAERWDINAFYIEQDVDGITDRQAVGGEIRYFSPRSSMFTLIDYDISYEELNIILFTGNLILADGTIFNLSADYRTSPILTTSNALQGQGVGLVTDLINLGASEDEVRNQAQAVTTNSWSANFGITHPLSEKLQISGDVTVTELKGTSASGGGSFTTIEPTPGTGIESFYNLQFIGSSLIAEGDIAILGFRYQNTSSSDAYSANLNTRYPLNRKFRINPRFDIDYRLNDEDDGEQLSTELSLRIDYRLKRKIRLELEGGAEWTTNTLGDQIDRTFGYTLILGYRIDF